MGYELNRCNGCEEFNGLGECDAALRMVARAITNTTEVEEYRGLMTAPGQAEAPAGEEGVPGISTSHRPTVSDRMFHLIQEGGCRLPREIFDENVAIMAKELQSTGWVAD